jgi:hypothetical protein
MKSATFSELTSLEEANTVRMQARLGLLFGFLVAFTMAVGAWCPDVLTQLRLPTPYAATHYLLGLIPLLLVGGLAGWLSARLDNGLASVAIWFVAAVLMSYVVGYIPSAGRTFLAWLVDDRFWGEIIYPFAEDAAIRLRLAGFFTVLILVLMAVVQNYFLEGVRHAMTSDGRLSGASWFRLFIALIPSLVAGLVTYTVIYQPFRAAPLLVHEAIQTGRTYEGDLFELSLSRGVNYSAIRGVREQLSGQYTLQVGEINIDSATTYIVATFSNGAWIICRVVADQLSYCYDAAPPYTVGLAAVITDTAVADDCNTCTFALSDEWRLWLQARGHKFDGAPLVQRLGQQGSHVIMQAKSASNNYTLQCAFHGLQRIQLDRCWE